MKREFEHKALGNSSNKLQAKNCNFVTGCSKKNSNFNFYVTNATLHILREIHRLHEGQNLEVCIDTNLNFSFFQFKN